MNSVLQKWRFQGNSSYWRFAIALLLLLYIQLMAFSATGVFNYNDKSFSTSTLLRSRVCEKYYFTSQLFLWYSKDDKNEAPM